LFQAFALPVRQGLPDFRCPLPGQPLPDVHRVDGDAGQDVGLALVAQQSRRRCASSSEGEVVEQQHRAVATRYDKRRYVCLGTATLVIWLRT
jgi:hypothetical protein